VKLTTVQPARHPNLTAKATGLAYLVFERPSLNEASRFLSDFGLRLAARNKDHIFFRGTDGAPFCYVARRGGAPRFVGLGLRVASDADLKALQQVAGASRIAPCSWPGSGWRVHLTDPSGFQVDAIHGQRPADELAHRLVLPVNAPANTHRVNAPLGLPRCTPEVIRLGHVALEAADFQATCGWYTQHFGFIPSDVQVSPDRSPAVAFLRLNLGDQPADHHTLIIAQGLAPAYSHSGFELVDADAMGMGQRVLRDQGRTHAWGMGRHTLGSQIFDYWRDPWGDKHGHCCDGDLFTAEVPAGMHDVGSEAMSQWGQAMPASFARPKLGLSTLIAAVRGLRRSPDLSLHKLHALMKAFG